MTKKGIRCRRTNIIGQTRCRQHFKAEGVCSICFEQGVNRELKCGHWFHRECFEKWEKKLEDREVTCPLCRRVEKKSDHLQEMLREEQVDEEAVLRVLQQLFPFPSAMLEQLSHYLIHQIRE